MIVAVEQLVVPRDGERACGDIAVVSGDSERTLLAVVDALGHGTNAEAVATHAAAWLRAAALDEGVEALVTGLHAELRGGRGACALLAIVSAGTMEVCSVGNVDMRWSRSRPTFMLTPGVLGHRLERLRVFRLTPGSAERVVVFTDGISARFDLGALATLSTADACRAIFSTHRRSHDDATVLVADFGP